MGHDGETLLKALVDVCSPRFMPNMIKVEAFGMCFSVKLSLDPHKVGTLGTK